MQEIYRKYIWIKDRTYHIFELYHFQALSSIFKYDISSKDLNLIKSIYRYPTITASEIISSTGISASNLSNRLTFLESKNLIIRKKDALDSRKYNLILTDAAHELIKINQSYTQHFIQYTKSSLSLSEKITFTRFLNQWQKKQKNSHHNKASYSLEGVENILDMLQNHFIHSESHFIEALTVECTYEDIFFLSELYLNQMLTKYSLPNLAKYLLMPYQTVISKIKKYTAMHLLTKEHKTFIFHSDLIHLIDNFISLRIINYYETLYQSSAKEVSVILKTFDLLKNYALETINKTHVSKDS